MSRRLVIIASALILAGGLAGCGKVGQLERPAPMFGHKHRAATTTDGARQPQDPTRPVETVDPRDRSTDSLPQREAPIPGTSQGASGVAPPTALPDPYARPR
jgi:hypothetical protein